MSVKPRFAGIGDCFTFSFDVSWIRAVAVQRCGGTVISLKSLVQSKALIQHKTAKKCGCLIAMGAKRACQGNRARRQTIPIVFDATHKRVG